MKNKTDEQTRLLVHVRYASAAMDVCARSLHQAVERARAAGATWSQIGELPKTSEQQAEDEFGKVGTPKDVDRPSRTPEPARFRTHRPHHVSKSPTTWSDGGRRLVIPRIASRDLCYTRRRLARTPESSCRARPRLRARRAHQPIPYVTNAPRTSNAEGVCLSSLRGPIPQKVPVATRRDMTSALAPSPVAWSKLIDAAH